MATSYLVSVRNTMTFVLDETIVVRVTGLMLARIILTSICLTLAAHGKTLHMHLLPRQSQSVWTIM